MFLNRRVSLSGGWVVLGSVVAVACVALGCFRLRETRGQVHLAEAKAALRVGLKEAAGLEQIDATRALSALEKATDWGYPDFALRWEAELIQALQAQELVRAEAMTGRVGVKHSPEYHWLRGELRRQQGKLGAASEEAKAALRMVPTHPRALLLALDLALDEGDLDAARAPLEALLSRFPKLAELHNRQAVVHEVSGQLADAERSLEEAVRHAPNFVDAWVNLGRVRRANGDPAGAHEAFDHAAELSSASADAVLGRGLACAELADEAAAPNCPRAAVDDFFRADALLPADATPLLALGDWHKAHGELALAIKSYREALQKQPASPVAWLKLGNGLVSSGEPEAAARAFEKAIDVSPDFAPAYNGLGVALSAMGALERAVASFERALDLDPLDPSARQNLNALSRS